LLLEPAALFFPGALELGWYGYLGLILVSLILATIWLWPCRAISERLSSPDSTIEIRIGDLFDQPDHLVIGTNDVFDTKLGNIIKPSSVQGQFLRRVYGSDLAGLDADINDCLISLKVEKKEEPNKVEGKRWRYPVGTTITLGSATVRHFFLTAYGHMDNNSKCTSNVDDIWLSLSQLWGEVRLRGQGRQVSVPIIGSDLARTGLPRRVLIKMIIISFIVASKEQYVARKLSVMIHPDDLADVNIYDLKEFLRSICF